MAKSGVELSVLFKTETDSAVLVHDFASEEDIWIPLSQVEEMHRDPKTQVGTIVITDWIARQKGLVK